MRIQRAMQNGINLIEKLVQGKKTGTIDYLKVCSIIRKIFKNFDMNENQTLEKDELKLLVDQLLEENLNANQGKHDSESDILREWVRKLDNNSTVSQVEVTKVICDFLKIKPPSMEDDDLPTPLIKKSAVMKRLMKDPKGEETAQTESQATIQNKHHRRLRFNQETPFIMAQLWKNYDIDGNGMLDTAEVRHFLNHHLKSDYGIEKLQDEDFQTWFRAIDKDGDGKVGIVEMALGVQSLIKQLKKKQPKVND